MTTETTTETRPARFALDERKATAWLEQAMYTWERGEVDPQYKNLAELSDDYTPLNDYESGSDTYQLVACARDLGAITGPGDVDYEFSNNGDGDLGYVWLLRISAGAATLKLASLYDDLRHCGDREVLPGIPSAMAVLREAVEAGNSLLDDLDAYVAARAAA